MCVGSVTNCVREWLERERQKRLVSEKLWLSKWKCLSPKSKFSVIGVVLFKEGLDFFMKHGGCEFVLTARRRAVKTRKDDRLTGDVESDFSSFERRVLKGKIVRKTDVGFKNIFVPGRNKMYSYRK